MANKRRKTSAEEQVEKIADGTVLEAGFTEGPDGPTSFSRNADEYGLKVAMLKERLKTLSTKDGVEDRFVNKSMEDMLVIEIFAGSARLSRACREVGLRAVAVDKTVDRSHGMHIFQCDLTEPSQFDMLVQFLEAEKSNICYAHFAPACGTASRAREKRLPNMEEAGYRVAQPCRSDDFPLGLPNISGLDKIRTELANQVYEVTTILIRMLVAWGVVCTLENPTNSLFWLVPCVVTMLQELGGFDTIFDNCCHGGLRRKSSRWWGSDNWFVSLEAKCPGETVHKHKSWKPMVIDGRLVYPTAEEAAYPKLLCSRVASILRDKLVSLGVVDAQDLKEQVVTSQPSLHRLILSALPRGKKFKPLVSEFEYYISLVHAQFAEVDTALLPQACKLAHQRLAKWGDVRVDAGKFTVDTSVHGFSDDDMVLISQYGVPHGPDVFIEKAVKCGHPRGMAIHLPGIVQEVLAENLRSDPSDLALRRCRELLKWTLKAKELTASENELKDKSPLHIKQLLAGKRLRLFGEMLSSIHYPDKNLISDIARGFPLTGWLETSGVFPKAVKHPQFSKETSMMMAQGLNKSIVQQLMAADDDDELVKQTWVKTLEEVSEGFIWLDGKYEGQKKLLAKRFGLLQRAGKLRVIDDCSIGGINGCLGVVEKYRIHAIDESAAYLAWCLDFCKTEGITCPILGRTYDLKSAYKQFGVSSSDRDDIRLAVRNPEDRCVTLFGVNSLPFGATGSVGGFLRVSLAIWIVGLHLFRIPWTAYFDDYTVFSSAAMAGNTHKVVEALFDLLGMKFARDGDKAVEFSTRFKSLGVEIDVSNFSKGSIAIGHTQDRRTELSKVLDEVFSQGVISTKQAESLRGRMRWFESFAFGRVANGAVKALGRLALGGKKNVKLSRVDLRLLSFLKDRVLVAPPLVITPSCLLSWIVFTDGACEGAEGMRVGSVGGVLVSPWGALQEFFGGGVPSTVMDRLLDKSKNPIYELEVIPVWIAQELWGQRMSGYQVCWYLDNDAARSAFIQGIGATAIADQFVSMFTVEEMKLQLKSWFARVPSSSNPSDGPSRFEDSFLRDRNAAKVEISWVSVERGVIAGSSNGGMDGSD